MKKILSLVLSLTVISGVCAAVLAYVNLITKDPIAQMKVQQEQSAVKAVLPPGVDEVVAADGFYVGMTKDNKIVGYAAKGKDEHGYGGDIELMVGFKADKRTVECYTTLTANETPGLGMKLKAPEFADQFRGKSAAGLSVKKDGGDIEAITSATITSRAVCRAIANAQGKIK